MEIIRKPYNTTNIRGEPFFNVFGMTFDSRKESNLFDDINSYSAFAAWSIEILSASVYLDSMRTSSFQNVDTGKCNGPRIILNNKSRSKKNCFQKMHFWFWVKMSIFFIKWNEFVNGIGKEGFYLFFLVFIYKRQKNDKLHFFFKKKYTVARKYGQKLLAWVEGQWKRNAAYRLCTLAMWSFRWKDF